jgi:HlyD family secretion protein
VFEGWLQPVTSAPVRRLAPVALVGALVLAACTGEAPPAADVGQVGRSTVTEVVEAPANVAARATATVSAPATGTVAVLAVRDGQRVTRGQVLLRIDSPSARQTLGQAQRADAQAASSGGGVPSLNLAATTGSTPDGDEAFAEARAAAAAIPDAKLRSEAVAKVAQAQAEYDTARAGVRRAVAQVDAGFRSLGRLSSSLASAQRAQTRAAVSAAQSAVDALTVRAPISGTVVFGGGSAGAGGAGASGPDVSSALSQLPQSVQSQAQSVLGGAGGAAAPAVTGPLELGAAVSSGGPLLTITDVSALSLTASVDETDVLLVRPGVPADVELDAVPGATYSATVRSVDLQPTTSSRGGVSYVVRLSLAAGRGEDGEAAPAPRPGMSAVARLRVRTAVDAVSVPAAAVFRNGARDAVWVVENGRAHRRDVRLGAQGDSAVQVASGLRGGESIVVRGADRVTEGQQVAPS